MRITQDKKASNPLVSIGLPIYNEEFFLRDTLDSLLAQDYSNIEIVISDNASTDQTEDICRDYANRFPEIRYIRFDTNKGQGKNFNKVLSESEGEFFMWASGHDLWSPNFISACLKKLNLNEDAIVAVPSCEWIDGNGKVMEKKSGFSDTSGMDPIARYFTMFWGNMHPAYGLMRTNIIKTWPIREIIGEDLIMMTFLALKGDFVHAENALWSRREFRFEKSYTERLKRYKKGDQKVAMTMTDKLFPFAKLIYYLFTTVLQSEIPLFSKMLIGFLLFPSIIVKFFSGKSQYKVA